MIFIAIFVGVNTVLCRYLNTIYAKHNGITMGTLANYVTGLLTSLVLVAALFVSGGLPQTVQPLGPVTFRTVMMFLGGTLGVVMIQIFIYVTPRLPAFLSTVLVIVAQLGTGLVLDYFLSGTFSVSKLIGGLLVVTGLWHYTWVSRRSAAKA